LNCSGTMAEEKPCRRTTEIGNQTTKGRDVAHLVRVASSPIDRVADRADRTARARVRVRIRVRAAAIAAVRTILKTRTANGKLVRLAS